ncbi:hypothetical protein SRHO_G00115740 [Serrasalmus rhombeus]
MGLPPLLYRTGAPRAPDNPHPSRRNAVGIPRLCFANLGYLTSQSYFQCSLFLETPGSRPEAGSWLRCTPPLAPSATSRFLRLLKRAEQAQTPEPPRFHTVSPGKGKVNDGGEINTDPLLGELLCGWWEEERIEGLVQMDPDLVRMEQGQSRNRSIKAKWPGRRNPALHGRAERGYQINLTLLLE